MRYSQIRSMDISNGEGIGISLFVQGCSFHCYNCFNPDTWDFDDGREWTQEVEDKFIELANRPYITRISILGGEPLAEQNVDGVLNLVNKIRLSCPDKTIWLYTGYRWEQIMHPIITNDTNPRRDENTHKRREAVSQCDVLVDGRFVDELKNPTLKWRGSENQRVVDVRESIRKGEIELWTI